MKTSGGGGGSGQSKPKGNPKGKGRGKSNPELDAALEKWEPVIGIEVHAQLSSDTKVTVAKALAGPTVIPVSPCTQPSARLRKTATEPG